MRELTDYPQPAIAVDIALITVIDGSIAVLVVHRDEPEQVRGKYALPGGFVHIDKSLNDTVAQVLREKANVKSVYLEQLATFGELNRDPRGRVISIAFFALIPKQKLTKALEGRGDLSLLKITTSWAGEKGGKAIVWKGKKKITLAFDHDIILGEVVKRLRGKLGYSAVGFELLPARFTLSDVQEIHEAILGTSLTKPAFRRKILDRGLIRATGTREARGAFRPAELYEMKK